MDASIHQAVSDAMGPFERRNMQYAYAIQAQRPLKRKSKSDLDLGAFERLKKAFLARPEGDSQSAPIETPGPSFIEKDEEESAEESADDAGPSRPWRPTEQSSPDVPTEGESDMLVPEDLVHPRSSEWTPPPLRWRRL